MIDRDSFSTLTHLPHRDDTTSLSHHQQRRNMADIKALKDAVWLKKQAIKGEEEGLAEWKKSVCFVECVMFHSANVETSLPSSKPLWSKVSEIQMNSTA
jgi:hypothetical protein